MLELELVFVVSVFEVIILEEGFYVGGVFYIFEICLEVVWDNGSLVMVEDFFFIMKVIFNFKVLVVFYWVYLFFIKEVEIDVENLKWFIVYFD